MKKLIISVVSTVMMIGAGAAFKSNQDVSVPTVEKLVLRQEKGLIK